MRLPEKPPADDELNALSATSIDVKEFETFRAYASIINSEYLHWDELPMRFKALDLKQLKLVWSYVNLSRGLNTRAIKLNGLVLRYVQTPTIEKELHNLDRTVGDKFEIDNEMPSSDLKKKYLINSLMEEAIASSQLEGAATTRLVAKKMLQEQREPRNKSERMILNNYLTMRYIKDNTKPNQPLTLELIKEIHKRIAKGTLRTEAQEGNFRTDNGVKVFFNGQMVYDPPDYNNVKPLLEQLCRFANSESSEYYLHPIVKAIVLHFMIGFIHPFEDGNGRTARALFYWYLISQQHYDYLEYVAVSTSIKLAPAQYMRAYLYAESDHNDITYFVKFNLRQLDMAVDAFKKYIDKTKLENKRIIETIRHNPRLNFRQADMIISLSKDERQVTIKEMQERYNITYQTARTDLLDLVEKKFLFMYAKGKRFFFNLNRDNALNAVK